MGGGTGTIEERVITFPYRKIGIYILTITAGLYLWGVLVNASYYSFQYAESLIETKRVQVYTPKEREWWQANSKKALNELLNPKVLVPFSFIKTYNKDISDTIHRKKSESNRR